MGPKSISNNTLSKGVHRMGIEVEGVNLVISNEMAKRIRERGLLLPVLYDYETPRIKAIAERQFELMLEMDKLDEELKNVD